MRSCMKAIAAAALLGLLATDVMAQGPSERGSRPPREGGREGGYGRGGGREGGYGRERGMRMPPSPLMRVLDADKNGELSSDEIANAAKALKALDKNEDGKLSREELRPQFPHGRQPGQRGGQGGGPGGRPGGGPPSGEQFVKHIMGFDKDGDGKVTKEELPEPMQRMLQRGDTNEDGAIDREEAEKLVEQLERFRRDRPQGGPGGAGFVERMMNLDRDGDGKVTQDEMPDWMRARVLERADTNGDGAIDQEEAEKMADQFERRRGGPPPGAGRDDRPERPPRPTEQ